MTGASQSGPSMPDSTLRPEGFDLQGHRGARGLAPENTIPAFRRALELGVTTLEMDVVVSTDGTVVVSHEPWMSHEICTKPSGAPVLEEEERQLNLYEMTYSEIEQYDCGSRGHPDFPGQKAQPATKPRLADVFEMAESRKRSGEHDRAPVFYNIEIKSRPSWDGRFHPAPDVFAEQVVRTVHEAGVTARTTIQSFDHRALRAARELEIERSPRVRFALLVGRGALGGFGRHVKQLGFTPDIYSPDYRLVSATLIQQTRKRGVLVVPWTVNDREAMRRLIRVGVDGLITDYPDKGVQVVRAAAGTSR